ncbi:tannase/feruloyl esterase family alpha/beta hydrolase [Kribbella sandramycini]|uniref:Feruloyl esterase n=1 Tax=Kribbella sandramycini TaxID=60450 RepID=A0A7Y4L1W0_9ACTN|nr:tannase/feruloyl esterase family alpha/beta hydrolase [Kribbella sandramycini]MBB6566564.1 feruloyl esterase [Kribbella sandramycini]NOL42779.1 tannase/feruloyl esterase family alpha/beta hydrolase [Kribbella sandramycini]
MKRILTMVAAVLPLAVLLPASGSTAATTTGTTTGTACSNVTVAPPSGARIDSVTAVDRPGGTVTFPPTPPFPNEPVDGVPAYCEVTVRLSHADDHVKTVVWLPKTGWNGRFQALGGSGYWAGEFGAPWAKAVKAGYAVASTDAGVGPSPFTADDWALKNGKVDRTLLTNFASRSAHDLAVVGKAVTKQYYGRAASYAYWNGCSTGGRQGYVEAQQHPDDFDGILAASPAINWERWTVSAIWPAVVMNAERNYPTKCEFDAFADAARQACDNDQPQKCRWAPERLIGKTILCEGKPVTITAADAKVVRKIWDGPRGLWYGLTRGTSFDGLAVTNGQSAVPFAVPDSWVRNFLKLDPKFDTSTLTYTQFAKLFRQSQAQYNRIIGSDDPDLSAFQRSGGKLLSWHGLADSLIPAQGTINYRRRVERELGGPTRTNTFYRLFLAPNAGHCGGGPAPTDPFTALVNWVEHNKPPATLPAANPDGSNSRELCAYPKLCR